MIAYPNIYDSLAEFMAKLDPEKVLQFHAPTTMQKRVDGLLIKKQEAGLSAAEQEELDHYLILEHIVRLAKSRARLHLSQARA
ncbi:MAG: hypothetical protein K9J37_20150 [Saprospiraceae bacterium]|nr:hypothetical protein [Saprospiraceae bacterium]MCF8252240.1 hypothetical protein [Saprospiraceae bacterium]MCF8282353.1 hypothetical protein [Bacteroidales bacterium]MCF8313880.1 hypothetical protein [Saprospiraceae bacterium]MCF8442899.1 hypothetical protein [Saprospiraceae bacterium]